MDLISCNNNFGKAVKIPKEKFFFRPSVYGLLKQKNKILTLTNKSNKKLWFPGGGVEIGEKMDEAYHAFLFFFSCELVGGELLPDEKVDDLEAEKPRWINVNCLNKNDISDLNEDIYKIIEEL